LGVRALSRLAGFLAGPQVNISRLADLDRALLERYLADLHAEFGGRRTHAHHLGALAGFLRAIRQHGWDSTLPATAVVLPEDYPARGRLLARALPPAVLAQIQQPASLDRWDNPAHQLITLILMGCGLRIGDAVRLPFDCVVTDADGAPYLRYYNHKMRREALVPLDSELRDRIAGQQAAVLERWPGGIPVLFPAPRANLDGRRPIRDSAYRAALHRWLQRCDIRDEHGMPVAVTPHQFRHTLGTTLKMSRVAATASFGGSGERALPAAQRGALGQARSHGSPCTPGDLGCHHPFAPGQTMMQPVRLQQIPT
jgi:integrase